MPKNRRTPKLGQHFLTSASVARAVAVAAGVTDGDTVLEIGPGKGILTAEILALGARVVAIEKDLAMVRALKETFRDELREKRLEILEADARDFLSARNPKLKTSYKVAANIPYYITGELLRLCLTAKHQPTSLAFLVQKEVAERIVGKGYRAEGRGKNKESILSLSVKVYGTPKYVRTVSRGSFSPPPNVDSAILSVSGISRERFTTPIYGCSAEELERRFFAVVKAGFAQKRKTLGGNLKRKFGERALKALSACGVSEKIRAEDVPLEKWLTIAVALG